MGEKRTKIDVSEETTRIIATRRAMGATLRELEAEFGFSRPVVSRVLGTELAKDTAKGIVEDAMASAVSAIRGKFSEMTEDAVKTLHYHLKEKKSLEALKIYLKAIGMESIADPAAPAAAQQQTLTVVLPGQPAAKTIEVNND